MFQLVTCRDNWQRESWIYEAERRHNPLPGAPVYIKSANLQVLRDVVSTYMSVAVRSLFSCQAQ